MPLYAKMSMVRCEVIKSVEHRPKMNCGGKRERERVKGCSKSVVVPCSCGGERERERQREV